MKKMSLHSLVAIALLVVGIAKAAPTVSDVTARQRYPWNGKVDITCTVSGMDGGTWTFAVAAVDPDSGDATAVSHVQVVRDGVYSDDLSVSTNGDYRLLWDAAADLGEIVRSNMVVRVTIEKGHDGKVQLWADGPYWAETNIGAESPEDYGLYFWWGDTVGYRREGSAWVASDGSSQNFRFYDDPISQQTCGKSPSTLQSEGWMVSQGGTYVLAAAHDAAHVHWGGAWRMPTYQELSALNSNCDWTWTMRNGVNGYVVSGRGDYTSASIFLPAAGRGIGTSLYYAGSSGFYWSAVPDSGSNNSWDLGFDSDYRGVYFNYRVYGFSVRPVQGFTE